MSERSEPPSGLAVVSISRRSLLQAGGVISLGALVAACGSGEAGGGPGRVGNVPPSTDLPAGEIDDLALLRTAQSLEYTAIDVYQTFSDGDLVPDDLVTPFEQFVEDHQGHADRLAGLIQEAGGQAFACPNPWFMDRAVGPIVQNIVGDEAAGIDPSDDPQRDAANVACAVENLAGASYQALVSSLTEPELRSAVMSIAADEVRHASVIAMVRTGTPEAYVSPQLTASEAEAEPDEEALPKLYVLTSQFGQLGAATLTIGAPNETGSRFSAQLETPAANSIIYEQMSCSS